MFCRVVMHSVVMQVVPMFCYNRSCGNRLFPCFVVCCVVMHSVVWLQIVVITCSDAQCCYNSSCGY